MADVRYRRVVYVDGGHSRQHLRRGHHGVHQPAIVGQGLQLLQRARVADFEFRAGGAAEFLEVRAASHELA